MRRFLLALLCDARGQPDEQAIISIAGAATFFGLEIYAVVAHGQNFDPLAFGTGIGTLLAATSAGFGLRAHLTPDPPANVDSATAHLIGDK